MFLLLWKTTRKKEEFVKSKDTACLISSKSHQQRFSGLFLSIKRTLWTFSFYKTIKQSTGWRQKGFPCFVIHSSSRSQRSGEGGLHTEQVAGHRQSMNLDGCTCRLHTEPEPRHWEEKLFPTTKLCSFYMRNVKYEDKRTEECNESLIPCWLCRFAHPKRNGPSVIVMDGRSIWAGKQRKFKTPRKRIYIHWFSFHWGKCVLIPYKSCGSHRLS